MEVGRRSRESGSNGAFTGKWERFGWGLNGNSHFVTLGIKGRVKSYFTLLISFRISSKYHL